MTIYQCRNCGGTIKNATSYDRATWVHVETGSAYCYFDVAEPALP